MADKTLLNKKELAQIQLYIDKKYKEQQAENEKREKINTYIAWLQFMAIPIEILAADYWPKSAKKEIPIFLDKCMSLYEAYCAGVVDMEQMEQDIFNVCSVDVKHTIKEVKEAYLINGEKIIKRNKRNKAK